MRALAARALEAAGNLAAKIDRGEPPEPYETLRVLEDLTAYVRAAEEQAERWAARVRDRIRDPAQVLEALRSGDPYAAHQAAEWGGPDE